MNSKKRTQIIEEMQKIAQKEGFYLVPQDHVSNLFKSLDYYNSEIKRLKLSRNLWRDKYTKLLANNNKHENNNK